MKTIIPSFLVLFVVSLGCKISSNDVLKKYKKFYYPNGILMKEGYYNEKNQPVDTLKTYSKDGKLIRLDTYNTTGKLNGINILYYSTGDVDQMRFFSNGLLTGKVVNYYGKGKLKSIGCARNGFLVGDVFHFYENGNYKAYNFLDFFEHNAIVHLYDSVTKRRVRKDGDQIIIDSIVYQGDSVNLSFLLAHPPYSKNEIILEEIDGKGNKIRTIQMPDTAIYFNLAFFKSSVLKSLILRVTQFDSLTNKESCLNNRYDLYD